MNDVIARKVIDAVNLESRDFVAWLEDVIEDENEGGFWVIFFNALLSRCVGLAEVEPLQLTKSKNRK